MECRLYHLRVARAQSDPAARNLHCNHSSHGGDGVCSGLPSTTAFCSDFIATCGTTAGWDDAQQCESATSSMISGTYPSQTSGNTFGCRAYHLGVAKSEPASSSLRAVHCGHASADGEDALGNRPCSGVQSPVSSFCADYISTCGTNVSWRSTDACIQEASGYVRGTVGDTSGVNTLECRIYHLTVAKSSPSNDPARQAHCQHAGTLAVTPICNQVPEGSDFCATYIDECSPGGAWADQATCATAFSQLARGSTLDTSGNSRGCRVYHLGAAMRGVTPGAAVHCSHASEDGFGVCVSAPSDPPTPPAQTLSPTAAGASAVAASGGNNQPNVCSDSSLTAALSRKHFSKSTSTYTYVVAFLIILVLGEYVLYLSAIQELVQSHDVTATSIHAKVVTNSIGLASAS